MANMTFGKPLDEGDTITIQGVSYPAQPLGMRVLRRMLMIAEGDTTASEKINAAVEVVLASVKPEVRDQLNEQIEETVPPALLVEIATALSRGASDLDPTRAAPSSAGSSGTGASSTDGAALVVSTP